MVQFLNMQTNLNSIINVMLNEHQLLCLSTILNKLQIQLRKLIFFFFLAMFYCSQNKSFLSEKRFCFVYESGYRHCFRSRFITHESAYYVWNTEKKYVETTIQINSEVLVLTVCRRKGSLYFFVPGNPRIELFMQKKK